MAEEKKYNGKIRGDSFDVIHRCQSFASDIFTASAGATKEYRFTICKIVQTLSCELIYSARIADLLPVIRKCKCLSLGQERELNNKLSNLKISYGKWIESDKKRIDRLNNHRG